MSDALSARPSAGMLDRPFTRRSLLVAALAGTAVAATGCTGGSSRDAADAVTTAQVDQLAAQVQVQEALVAACDRAFAAAPALATAAAPLAAQLRAQLDRLRAAAPGTAAAGTGAAGSTAATGSATAAPALDAAGARAYLRTEVATAADSHATACPQFTGGRAALLGSIAAGLRGMNGQLA
jgi:hypothetical protein